MLGFYTSVRLGLSQFVEHVANEINNSLYYVKSCRLSVLIVFFYNFYNFSQLLLDLVSQTLDDIGFVTLKKTNSIHGNGNLFSPQLQVCNIVNLRHFCVK